MQLTPRYLVNNRTVIVIDEAGFTVEYRPVYQRNLYVYKGIDNVLQFQVKNADQKPVDITNYTPILVAFDEDGSETLKYQGSLLDDGSSGTRGVFKVTVRDSDILNVKQQYLTYTIYLKDSDNEDVLTYANEHFEAAGIIYVSARAFPSPMKNKTIDSFSKVASDLNEWTSDIVQGEPDKNGNQALHTAAVYSENFTGDVVVQGTLENQVKNQTVWADIATISLDNETEPRYINFNGVFSYLRFKTDVDPENISKILVRN